MKGRYRAAFSTRRRKPPGAAASWLSATAAAATITACTAQKGGGTAAGPLRAAALNVVDSPSGCCDSTAAGSGCHSLHGAVHSCSRSTALTPVAPLHALSRACDSISLAASNRFNGPTQRLRCQQREVTSPPGPAPVLCGASSPVGRCSPVTALSGREPQPSLPLSSAQQHTAEGEMAGRMLVGFASGLVGCQHACGTGWRSL